jgi:uncharacterized protein GlcG (DUF336 family)
MYYSDASQACANNTQLYNASSTIVVADSYGYPIAILRIDNAYLESIDTCIRKARTVSRVKHDQTATPGPAVYGIERTNGGTAAIPGALPLFINGHDENLQASISPGPRARWHALPGFSASA